MTVAELKVFLAKFPDEAEILPYKRGNDEDGLTGIAVFTKESRAFINTVMNEVEHNTFVENPKQMELFGEQS